MSQIGGNRIVEVPGSKSIANRALICAALADSESVISNCAPGDDTAAMISGLMTLGVKVDSTKDVLKISGQLDLESQSGLQIDAKLAGTTSRFLTALCALRRGESLIDGLEPLRKRPMAGLHEALRQIGANVNSIGERGCLPVEISRGENTRAQIAMSANTSSQFTSALMMIAPYLTSGLEIELDGTIVSRGYIEMTVGVMRAFGALTDFSDNKIWVSPGRYVGTKFSVEPDASSASYLLAAVAISGGQLTVANLSRNSLQADIEFADLLAKMGCQTMQVAGGLKISRDKQHQLTGINVDMSQMSDCVPTLAVVSLFATTPTVISGVGFIRSKESDRIGDLANELRKVGADISETDDGLVIQPAPLKGANLDTHHDHRLAMAFALLGREVAGVVVKNPEVVSKSWPNYFEAINTL